MPETPHPSPSSPLIAHATTPSAPSAPRHRPPYWHGRHYDPETQGWGAVHGRARFAILRLLLETSSGAEDASQKLLQLVWSEDEEGPDVRLQMARELIDPVGRPAIGHLLLTIHVARCSADKSLASEFERLTSVPEELMPLWRVVKQRRAERDVFVQSNTVLVKGGGETPVLKSYPPTREGLLTSFVDRWGVVCM